MKKATAIGISILIIAIAGFFFSSYAAQIKKTTIKPLTIKTTKPSQTKEKAKKPYSKDTSKKSLKQILQQPDLVVEALRLKGGFIAFTLKNTGPGSLPDDDHKQGRVKVSYKGFEKTYTFREIDPKGKLKKPGGSLPCPTGIMLTSRQDVAVVVSYGKNKKSMLTRTLGKTQPSRIAKSGKKTGLKDISEAPTKQKKALKTPSKKDKVSARPMAEPLISIAKVYQKDGKIHIVVKNKGRGRLSTRDYMQGKVSVNIGGKTRSWPLKKIDPTGRLGRYGGEVEFDTGIRLKKKERVKVSIEKVKAEKFKPLYISPKTGPMMAKTARSISREKIKKPVKETAELNFQFHPLPKALPDLQSPQIEGLTALKGVVTRPRLGEKLIKGDDYTISWYNYSYGNLVNILLREEDTPIYVLASYVNNNHGVNFYTWHISHTCAMGPRFKIRLKSMGGAIMAESRFFEITQDEKPDLTLSDVEIVTFSNSAIRWLQFKLKNENWEHAKILLANPHNLSIQTCAMWERCMVWGLSQCDIDSLNQRGYVDLRYPWEYECDTRIILDFDDWIDEFNEPNNLYIFEQQGICGENP